MKSSSLQFLCGFVLIVTPLLAVEPAKGLPGDRMLADYFQQELDRLHADAGPAPATLEQWTSRREAYRQQLQEMLGLAPWPERTPLNPVVTGKIDHPEIEVEKVHFQSLPGLYVTGNLYLPKHRPGKVPAILYVCGHAGSAKRVPPPSGAKAVYQHHGAWLAQNGYVCFVIDTIENGDIIGVHRGTKWHDMWWWNSRGYTPAGVEAWNAMRALDYLQSRPEVDGEKLGMTGRSGGGFTTWFAGALDDRIKVAVPVAGLSDLQSHVVDGYLSHHCDCAFMVNTYRWDFSRLAMLLAPRPLRIVATDRDQILPLVGVMRVNAAVTNLYRLYGSVEKLGLAVGEGVHSDSQELQLAALRWFNRFLKDENPLVETVAKPLFAAKDLAVFDKLPTYERTSTIHESFVPVARPAVPADAKAWAREKASWLAALKAKSFAAWPAVGEPFHLQQLGRETKEGIVLTRWEFVSQGAMRLPLFVFTRAQLGANPRVRLQVLDDAAWKEFVAEAAPTWPVLGAPDGATPGSVLHKGLLTRVARGELTLVYLPPRGVGPTSWAGGKVSRNTLTRSFMVLGETVEGMRVWDIRRAIEALRQPEVLGAAAAEVELSGERFQAVNALYASLFAPGITSLELIAPPASHRTGPDYLNVLRFLDVPQAAALAAERCRLKFVGTRPDAWTWTTDTARRLGWPADRLQW